MQWRHNLPFLFDLTASRLESAVGRSRNSPQRGRIMRTRAVQDGHQTTFRQPSSHGCQVWARAVCRESLVAEVDALTPLRCHSVQVGGQVGPRWCVQGALRRVEGEVDGVQTLFIFIPNLGERCAKNPRGQTTGQRKRRKHVAEKHHHCTPEATFICECVCVCLCEFVRLYNCVPFSNSACVCGLLFPYRRGKWDSFRHNWCDERYAKRGKNLCQR
jgi:hypothetical protein